MTDGKGTEVTVPVKSELTVKAGGAYQWVEIRVPGRSGEEEWVRLDAGFLALDRGAQAEKLYERLAASPVPVRLRTSKAVTVEENAAAAGQDDAPGHGG